MAKIMVAENQDCIRILYRELLTIAGYDIVAETVNGFETLDSYTHLSPDLLIIDNKMDKLNGIMVVQKIMRLNHQAKIIMCTADYDVVAKEAMSLGVKDVLPKPFCIDQFMKSVSSVLEISDDLFDS